MPRYTLANGKVDAYWDGLDVVIRDIDSRLERLEETLAELLDEPGNPYLGYEMARSRLSRPLPIPRR